MFRKPGLSAAIASRGCGETKSRQYKESVPVMINTDAENPKSRKPNWLLICGGGVAGILIVCVVVGLVAMYVANFNLLGWIE
jgi:hypothetical protein